MATSKSLQKPEITQIIGSTIRVKHPDIHKNIRSFLASQIAAAGVSMIVIDNLGFEDNDWYIVGEVGDLTTETNDVNGAVTRGTSLTVTNAQSFDHEINAPITKINERGIKIYGAATDGGAGTIIESIDAKTAAGRQLADAQMIEWNKEFTEYTLISTDTAYAYYYVEFVDGAGTVSAKSDYVASTGLSDSSVESFIQDALDLVDAEISSSLTRETCVRWANQCQKYITQYVFQDPSNGQMRQIDWGFEMLEDITSLTISENENAYALSDLSTPAKYTDTTKIIIDIRMGDRTPLKKRAIDEYDDLMAHRPRTNVATEANAGDTTLVVDSNVEYSDNGIIYLGSDTVSYTGKTGTNTFTGIPASGSGSITATWVVGSPVWQSHKPGEPSRYTIFNGTLYLDKPPASKWENFALKIRYFKKLTSLTEISDVTEVTFTNIFHLYIASKIQARRTNFKESQMLKAEFERQLLSNAESNSVPMTDEKTYYNFMNTYPQNNDMYYSNNRIW